MPKKKLKQWLASAFAACLLLSSFGALPAFAESTAKGLVRGAAQEIYSGETLLSKKEFDTAAQAWSSATAAANDTSETVITLYEDWTEDEMLTVAKGQHLTLDLNGHTLKRNRNHDMKADGCVIRVQDSAVFTLRDSNPKSRGYDGVKGGVITGGASSNTAGGVHIDENGAFIMEGGTIYDCITDADGGAVCVDGGSENTSFTMTGGRLYSCKTMESADECCGGAVYLNNGNVTISGATIDDCYSEDDGGAIYSERGKITMKNVVFSGNRCLEKGGAIAVALDSSVFQGTLLNAYDCTFAGNRADEDGGAVIVSDNPKDNGAVVFYNCKFRNNEAAKNGGAIYINDDNVALSGCSVTANRAAGSGGGIFVDCRYNLTLMGLMTVKDNTAGKGDSVANLTLESGATGTAYIIDGGIYKNSSVHIGTTSKKSILLSEWMSQYQMQYFVADEGTLDKKEERFVDASMVVTASIFSEGSITVIAIFGAVGLAAAAILIIRKKKNKKAGDEYDA